MPSSRRRLSALRRLRRVQKLTRDRAAVALAESNAVRISAEQSQVAAKAQRTRLEGEFVTRVMATSQTTDLESVRAEHAAADESIIAANRQHESARRECQARLARVAEAEQKIAVTDKLTDRERKTLARAIDRAEQLTIDDLAPTRRKAQP